MEKSRYIVSKMGKYRRLVVRKTGEVMDTTNSLIERGKVTDNLILPNTWLVKRHKTPYTDVLAKVSDRVRHRKVNYTRGSMYRMEGVLGYEYFQMAKRAEVTELQVLMGNSWQTIMIDDPLHWTGMKQMAKKSRPGTVLVTGLGMGLILHPLVKRKDITKITVVEIDPAIIEFTTPYIPKDDRIEIELDNFFSHVIFCATNGVRYNTTLIDLWVISGKEKKEERRLIGAYMNIARHLASQISDKVMLWGVRGY